MEQEGALVNLEVSFKDDDFEIKSLEIQFEDNSVNFMKK